MEKFETSQEKLVWRLHSQFRSQHWVWLGYFILVVILLVQCCRIYLTRRTKIAKYRTPVVEFISKYFSLETNNIIKFKENTIKIRYVVIAIILESRKINQVEEFVESSEY